jgi:hypothetical protein
VISGKGSGPSQHERQRNGGRSSDSGKPESSKGGGF